VITPRPEVASLPSYRPGRPDGTDATRLINLAANESAWPDSPSARAATDWAVQRYPDMGGQVLKDQMGAAWGLDSSRLLLGTGSGHLIKCLCEAYLRPGDTVVTVSPTFSLYRHGASLMGANTAVVPSDGHQVRFAAVPAVVAAKRPRLVFLCSPNNPTGDAATVAEVRDILAAAGPDSLVVVDEAYQDFANPGANLVAQLDEWPSLAVLRTLSKAYGLAGLRVGALLAHPLVIDAVARVREPFPVSAPALAMGARAVADAAYHDQVVAAAIAARRRLEDELRRRQWRVNPSQGNFVWAVPPDPWTAAQVKAGLERRGVLVRHGESFGAPDHLRITVGTPAQMDGLLLQLDDVTQQPDAG